MRSVQPRALMVSGVATLVVIELLSTFLAPGIALFSLPRVVEGSSVGVATGAIGVLRYINKKVDIRSQHVRQRAPCMLEPVAAPNQ